MREAPLIRQPLDLAMIEAGATRIGASASLAIIGAGR